MRKRGMVTGIWSCRESHLVILNWWVCLFLSDPLFHNKKRCQAKSTDEKLNHSIYLHVGDETSWYLLPESWCSFPFVPLLRPLPFCQDPHNEIGTSLVPLACSYISEMYYFFEPDQSIWLDLSLKKPKSLVHIKHEPTVCCLWETQFRFKYER